MTKDKIIQIITGNCHGEYNQNYGHGMFATHDSVSNIANEIEKSFSLASVKNCVLIETKVQKLIKKLETENIDRKKELSYDTLLKETKRRINHKYNYTCEIIQQLKNCS